MPVASVDLLHGIVNSSTFISQFTSQELSPGIEALVAHASGQVHPQFAANMGQRPEVRFTTPQVKSILDLVGSTGIYDLSGANTDLFFKVAADQGSRGASASMLHHRFRVAQGFLVLERLTAGHRSEAQAQCRIICGYDGTNSPLVYAGSQALSGTPASGEHYVLGECHLNSAEVDGVQDLDMDWGHNILQAGSSGELYDTFNALLQSSPTVSMTALNSAFWSTATINGLDLSAASLYLRKLARSGRVADNVAEHIKFTLADGLIFIDRTTGEGMSPNTTTIQIRPIAASDTGVGITLSSTTVAITT